MEFLHDFLSRFLQTENTAAFWCDADLVLRKVSPAFPLSNEVPLASLFDDMDEYHRAEDELVRGAVFVSTKCELFRPYSTILLLPILHDSVLQGVFGVLETSDSAKQTSSSLFITQVSDRYRTPVTNILNMLSTLSGVLQGEEHARERVYLNVAAKECYTILRGVLPTNDYARLVNGTMPYHPQAIVVNDLLEDLQAALRPFFRKRGQQLRFVLPQTPVIAMLDPRLSALALFHLLANAAAFSPADSTITITLRADETYFTITVADEGDGISAEYLPRVFEPFFTCPDHFLPEEQLGTGLGLPTVRAIAKLHGGDVFLTSERNRGTTATLRFPLADKEQAAHTVQADTHKYVTDKFSDLYVLFAGICDIDLFY